MTQDIAPSITLPEYLHILRRRAGLSQLNAASQAGMTNRHLYRLEHALVSYRIEDIYSLATLYGVAPATFLAVDATAPEPPENGRS